MILAELMRDRRLAVRLEVGVEGLLDGDEILRDRHQASSSLRLRSALMALSNT